MNLDAMIREATGDESTLKEIVKLHGDASYRTYLRAVMDDGRTFILMQMPAGKASASEEITNLSGTHEELPFINVARFLDGRGIRVPKIYKYFDAEHVMVLEDMGDNLMAKNVEGASDDIRRNWYRRAIDLLVLLQARTEGRERSECVALNRSFDPTLLNWEFDHFLEYGVGERLGKKMTPADHEIFTRETRNISSKIGKLPYGFTHRDFQSRNIIIMNNDLCIIDFQDALLGPQVYDLVALLRDSYVALSQPLLEELVRYYCGRRDCDYETVRAEFDLVTCQRKLKDAGRFVYIDRVKKNPHFLKYIPASLGYVKQALERLPEHASLYEMLKRYVPEWNQ